MSLSGSQEAVLRHLYRHGDDVPVNMGEATDFHSKSISRGLSGLESDGLVENKGSGVYTLTPAGFWMARELVNEET
jgi:Mn-dependent DtxR family transcriptional regulator